MSEQGRATPNPGRDIVPTNSYVNSCIPPFRIDSGAPWDVFSDSIQGHPNSLVSRDMRMASTKRLLPTGECWCGCSAETAIGSFFLPGHDKSAESAVISV